MKQLRGSVLKAALLLCLSGSALGQSSNSRVFVTIRNPPEVLVSIDLSTPTDSWSFRNSYAGALGLGDRIRQFQANESEKTVSVRTLAPGEFRLGSPVNRVSYLINISPTATADLPHISWLTNN